MLFLSGKVGACAYVLLFLICLSIVIWQLYNGTIKYISEPHGVKSFTEQLVLPDITVCHYFGNLAYNLPNILQYINEGKFTHSEMKAEVLYEKVTEEYFYLLDQTGISVINMMNKLMSTFYW